MSYDFTYRIRHNIYFAKVLDMSFNLLTGTLPSTLGAITTLEKLYLDDNQITGEVPNLSRLIKMAHIFLAWNSLTGLFPQSIWSLTELQTLSFFDNVGLSGTIPTSVSGE